MLVASQVLCAMRAFSASGRIPAPSDPPGTTMVTPSLWLRRQTDPNLTMRPVQIFSDGGFNTPSITQSITDEGGGGGGGGAWKHRSRTT